MKASNIFIELKSSPLGLSDEQARSLLSVYGENVLKVKRRKPLILQFLEEFTDLMVIILIFASILAIYSGELVDGVVILFIVILNATIGFIQKYKAEKALEALKKMISPRARVLRDGREMAINASQLVPGDILILSEGDQIPADGRIIEEYELECQEATLSGESTPVAKTSVLTTKKMAPLEDKNRIFMGTVISHGSGKAIVTHTGMKTEFGKIADLTVSTEKEKSPLQKELFRIGVFVGKITLIISSLLLLTGIFIQGNSFIDSLLFSISVAVAAVPEGLPATVTIALAIGVQNLVKKKAIVKQLSSVETLGSTTVICTDKTGTLTKNEMTVKEMHFDLYEASVKGSGYEPIGTIPIHTPDKGIVIVGTEDKYYSDYEIHKKTLKDIQQTHEKLYTSLELLMSAGAICNNAKLERKNDTVEMLGDPTEGAILTAVEKSGFSIDEILEQYHVLHQIPFDSTRKKMTVIVRNKASKKVFAFIKGAPDEVIVSCSNIILNNRKLKLDTGTKKDLLNKNAELAGKALRVIGFGYKELPDAQINQEYNKDEIEKDITYIGMMGMIDPPRPDVEEAIKKAKTAGIKIYVVTGDHGLTAQAIGKQLDLISDKRPFEIITGEKLDELSDLDLQNMLTNKELDIIFARVSPEHKLRVVSLLKHQGEIVAVTGDGVNDAPALKKADIGVAMGVTGTDVSKEAANMILTDDSFASIISAVEEGRRIYINLRKFIFYIFSCNVGEILTVLVGIILNLPAPLTAILILTVDLGTDVLPALAIGVDPPDEGLMQQKPRDPKAHIMNKTFVLRFLFNGLCIGIIVSAVFLFNLLNGGWHWGESLARTDNLYLESSSMAFALLVLIQMVNAYNVRSEEKSILKIGIFNNLYLLGAIMISIIIVVSVVEIPFIQNFMHTTHLSWDKWLLIIFGSLTILLIEEIRKFIKRNLAKTNGILAS